MRARFTVLLIEDQPAEAELARVALEEVAPDVRVLVATGGTGGIEMAVREDPDLIILDLVLPDVDGLAVLRALRADPQTARTPVLVLSMLSDDRNVWEAYFRYANGFMIKPTTFSELLGMMRAVCGFWFRYAALARPGWMPDEV